MTYRVATDGLNVRNRVNGKIVDVLGKGHIVEVVALHQGKQLEWARITYDRYGGWVARKFLERVEEPAPVPQPEKQQLPYWRKEIYFILGVAAFVMTFVWQCWTWFWS